MKKATVVKDRSGRLWAPKRGLEGPFRYRDGTVLYYDPRYKGGRYYDPTRDQYLDNMEATKIISASKESPVSNIRTATIKLAHAHSELRKHLVPLLREAAAPSYQDYVKKKRSQGKSPLSKEQWEKKVLNTGRSGDQLKKKKEEEDKEPNKKKFAPRKKDKGKGPSPFAERGSPEDKAWREKAKKMKEETAKKEKAKKKDKGKKKKKEKTFVEKKQEWLKNVKDPKEKKRIQKMSPKEFDAMVKSVGDDEEE